MRPIARNSLLLLLVFSLFGGSCLLIAANRKKPHLATTAATPGVPRMDEPRRAEHALSRLTYGPRPGDVDKVRAMGVDRWIEQQLHPEDIADNGVESQLAPLRTLKMSTREMVENFPPPQLLKAMAEGRVGLPFNPEKRALYQAEIENYRARKQNKEEKDAQKNASDMQVEGAAPAAGDSANGGKTMTGTGDVNQASGTKNALEENPGAPRVSRAERMAAEAHARQLMAMPADQRLSEILKMAPGERRVLTASLQPDEREQMVKDFSPQQRETLQALVNPRQVVTSELQQGKILRAAYSERQLEEVMTDFWFNHFNVFINKGADRYMVTSFERDVIRPRVFGKFKDLLLATAQSPAMLFYLDNWQSVGPHSELVVNGPRGNGGNRAFGSGRPKGMLPNFGGERTFGMGRGMPGGINNNGAMRPPNGGNGGLGNNSGMLAGNDPERLAKIKKAKKAQGLNENYAREVMELHTLGVDGGYTQSDVTELAKVLTGWTIQQPQRGGDFQFDERRHEPGAKTVLGETFQDQGEQEGVRALELLARQPATAKFISRKLAMRFVSDNPPAALVERMSQTYLRTDGDIREVLRAMFHAPEFWAPETYRAKVKTPFEFVISAIRATGAGVQNPAPLAQALNKMGMPLYGMQPPTGYSMRGDAWINSAALLDRMNFALALGSGKIRGANFNPQAAVNGAVIPADSALALGLFESSLLSGEVSQQTHQTILRQLINPEVTQRKLDDAPRPAESGVIAGLILGSPEFQRR